MKEFPSCVSIIEKFIQSEIDANKVSNEYILALNECTTLEDLVDEVSVWKDPNVIEQYRNVENYILMSLDREYD
jgi:5-methylcytosine-specific restriction endonuclease McrBC regulatory subunit McrC